MPSFKTLLPATIFPGIGYGFAASHVSDPISAIGVAACGLIGGVIITTWLSLIFALHE